MNVEVTINMQAFEAAVERQVKPIMEDILNEASAIIDEQSQEPKSGRDYRPRGGRGRRASAPGESPAKQTGALVGSITKPEVFKSGGSIIGQITITAPHAILLTRGTGRIAPRPIAQPAVEELLRRRA
jgi:hypothetical protein